MYNYIIMGLQYVYCFIVQGEKGQTALYIHTSVLHAQNI